ncbi:MAG: DJ-1/PfpI family protein [Dysgonamonadaceae bacterium]|jgi:4-methyl-5(b-hydroxyethyl)-thiazole monophosphate biosynthesis|nr:DJ-1/PfpI family protein [Dysgonamonadaceae bacterium]
MKAFLFLANGFEETEAIVTADILKRGGVEVITVSVTGQKTVPSVHDIPVVADALFDATDFSEGDLLILPGGMPGADNLYRHEGLHSLLLRYDREGKRIAAICAAPFILGKMNLLSGKPATVYPGFEDALLGATLVDAPVVKAGHIITSTGPGTVFDFGLALVAELMGTDKSREIADAMLIISK